MSVGLQVWDRQGNLLTDITHRYPKFIDSLTVANDTEQTIHYTPPNGSELIYAIVFLGKASEFVQTQTAVDDEIDSDRYEGNAWSPTAEPLLDMTGIQLTAKANGKNRVPFQLFWGYW